MCWESVQIWSRYISVILEQGFLSKIFYLLQKMGAQLLVVVIHPAQ